MKNKKNLKDRPIFHKMDDGEKSEYISDYIEKIFKKSGRLQKRIPYNIREDIAQELYIDLWNNINKYKPELSAFSTYAHHRSRGVIQKALKQYIKQQKIFSPLSHNNNLYYENNILLEDVPKWDEIIKVIPSKYHKILEMKFIHNKSINEISKEVDLTPVRIYQILRRLKKYATSFQDGVLKSNGRI